MQVSHAMAVTIDSSTGTYATAKVKARAQGESVTKMAGKVKPVLLKRSFHVLDVEYSLLSLSSLCNDPL